ncbi:MAG: NADH-quinone oxidoreductase subunit J [Candidatus Lambdaproteobacteria bacterium]|nr:NADH-quinone oxidoreductase subunit J [Candidatus Lambdaproteobacteria bacterium]
MLVFFYLFAAAAVLGALGVLLLRNPVYCALSLVATMSALGGVFILLNQEFVAAIQILIYAGAIMVLFLFVIMLLNLRSDEQFIARWNPGKVVGIAMALVILAQLVGVFTSASATLGPAGEYPAERIAKEGAVEIVGGLLVTQYVLPFEVASILLMVAIIGAVVIAKRQIAKPSQEGR